MRKAQLLVLVLVAVLLLQPFVLAAEIPRHLDPATLPEENPDPEKLFQLYYMIFHEAAVENFTGARSWLVWAGQVKALPNLGPSLGEYQSESVTVVGLLEDVRLGLDDVKSLVQLLRSAEARMAIEEALVTMDEADSTVERLASGSAVLGSILGYSASQLDAGIVELRGLVDSYRLELMALRGHPDVVDDPSVSRPTLVIELDKLAVQLGDILFLRGGLLEASGAPLPGRSITIYFDGGHAADASTVEDGSLKAEFMVPYLYEDNATVYAEYVPSDSDMGIYGRSVSNIVTVNLTWFRPVLEVELPGEAYPGTDLTLTGLLSYGGVGLPGVEVLVTAFKGEASDETSRKGTISLTIRVPDGYPEGEELVVFRSEPAGIYGSAEAEAKTVVSRFPSFLEVSSPDWLLSGSKLSVAGRVVTLAAVQGCGVELRSEVGSTSTIAGADGGFKAEVDLPHTLFTSTYTYQVFLRPSPWIRGSTVTGSVLVVNLFTVISVPVLLIIAFYMASKRIRGRPNSLKLERPAKVRVASISPAQQVVAAESTPEPSGVRGVFLWAVSVIGSRFGAAMARSMTIREWLGALRGKLDGPLFGLVERLGLLYERSLYGKADEGGDVESTSIYSRIRDLLS